MSATLFFCFKHVSSFFLHKFVLYYIKKDTDIAINYLEKYCQCFDYLVVDFVYQKDEFFEGIDEWLNTLPLEGRLPANYENTLNIICARILENENFVTLDNFGYIKKKLLRIYNKKDEG